MNSPVADPQNLPASHRGIRHKVLDLPDFDGPPPPYGSYDRRIWAWVQAGGNPADLEPGDGA